MLPQYLTFGILKEFHQEWDLILDMSPRALEKILYFASYVVLDPKETSLLKKQLLNEKEYREAIDKYGDESFVAGMGAEAVKDTTYKKLT